VARQRVLVIAPDHLEGQVAGTGIRALELARVLAADADVTLAGVGDPPAELAGIPCVGYHPQAPSALEPALRASDVVVAGPQWPPLMRRLERSGARLLFDLYVPEAIETVGGFPGDRRVVRALFTRLAVDRLIEALRSGSGFVCASERQRDLLLGVLLGQRLIDPARHDADPSLRSLIDVVPFGLPQQPAVATTDGPRSAFPDRIGPDDEVVLWNGGLWPWLDAKTAIRAVALLAERRPSVRLVFMGAARQVPAQRAAEDARALASSLGVLDRTVLFNEDWVPYERRADWLLHAACAVSAHGDHLETRFAFRTRLLDCFWARLPVVCTAGDDLADVVDRGEAGHAVPAGDVTAMAAALETVLDRGRAAYDPALARIAARYSWPVVAQPLVRMVAGPASRQVRAPVLRPAHAVRRSGYLAARRVLNVVGLRDWPRL
jgi:glycosyltransferase involved in cell wall biosynthesis